MSAPTGQRSLLDALVPEARAGFRLCRLEVYNWGTFHDRVWVFQPDGENALLTGDIGSGKSTLVDAITTLLVPPGRLAYNKAAGADARERTLRSYVLGYYKSERGDVGLSAKPVALRDHNSYSVLLAQFFCEDLAQTVTLAQVFWIHDARGGPPARLYLVADAPLGIAQHFAGFGAEISELRKRLRALPNTELFDSYPPYGAHLRRRFGIESESALDLFHQTVSMKSVGDLTHFVRAHMLEAFDVETRIQALLRHFDDLQRAHEAVRRAREQVERLVPIVDDCERYTVLVGEIEALRGCREAIRPWIAGHKAGLLERRVGNLEAEITRLSARETQVTRELDELDAQRAELKRDIEESGGARIEALRRDMDRKEAEKKDRLRRASAYDEIARELGLPPCADQATFEQSRAQAVDQLESTEQRRAASQNELTEASVELRQIQQEHGQLGEELRSLRSRRSNIPAQMLAIREQLCQALGASPDALPFAGELLSVRDDARDWEGAIERLLHGYGLSLLVSDAHYAAVSDWVNRTHLHARLVYLRVRAGRTEPAGGGTNTLWRRLDIQPESPFADWLEADLSRRFEHICCDTMEQFRREHKAITRSGQIKGGHEHHEKDDRHRLEDRTRYVLGWSNQKKIAAYEAQIRKLEARGQKAAERYERAQKELRTLDERKSGLARLADYKHWSDLDWRTLAVEIQRLDEERQALERTSDRLRTLGEQLRALEARLAERRGQQRELLEALGKEREKLTRAQTQLEQARLERQAASDALRERYPRLDALAGELQLRVATVESCEPAEKELREQLQRRIDAEDLRLRRLGEKISAAMQAYRSAWPLETQEVDTRPQAGGAYRQMLDALRADDLPRFEARFKQLLNENTIREIANFQSQLHRERQQIKERVDIINRSLHGIDYNPGRYIRLEAVHTSDADIRDFQQSLRACTEGALTGSEDDTYSEAKFLQVKTILERFRGREGSTDADRRWTEKVTDVRSWFLFAASERWREDDREHEHYSDSGGKSGGQKEKLAYTVLAASLAYQFGLDAASRRPRSFRFAVIDEAFGRGSDESARFGLELFQRLNLQILVVTPLQKIHIIEPYVAAVGFVHNDEGRRSMLRCLSVEAYRAERAARSG